MIKEFKVPINIRFPPIKRVWFVCRGTVIYGTALLVLMAFLGVLTFAIFLKFITIVSITMIPVFRDDVPFYVKVDYYKKKVFIGLFKWYFFETQKEIKFDDLYVHFDYSGHRTFNFSLQFKILEIWNKNRIETIMTENPEAGWYPEEVQEVYEELKKVCLLKENNELI